MEESDADFFYETLQDMDIQKNESDIRVPMLHKACADFAMEQASKGNDNLSPFRLCEKMGFVMEGRRRNTVYTDGIFYDEILYGLTKDEFSELINQY